MLKIGYKQNHIATPKQIKDKYFFSTTSLKSCVQGFIFRHFTGSMSIFYKLPLLPGSDLLLDKIQRVWELRTLTLFLGRKILLTYDESAEWKAGYDGGSNIDGRCK